MHTKEIRYKYVLLLLCTICAAGMLISCAGKNSSKKPSISNGVDIPVMPNESSREGMTSDEYTDVMFKAVVLEVNVDDKTIILQKTSSDNRVLYSYTGGTNILNKHGDIMSASQLNYGEIVEVAVSLDTGKITDIKIYGEGFDYPGVTNFSIDKDKKMISVGSEKYFYTDNTVFLSGSQIISADNLEGIDVITLKGYDKQLDSVIITTGHGYLRLDTTTFFEGGYIEIGDKIVESITENMVLAVPVGTYTVTVTKDKTSGSKEIIVNSNEEQRLNLIEFQSEAVRLGTLSFKISPSGAKLTIDGVEKDYSQIIDVAFGTHKIVVTADGYEPYAQLITVEEIFKEYSISLLPAEETTEEDESETSSQDSDDEEETSTTKKETETTTTQTIDYSSILDSLFS